MIVVGVDGCPGGWVAMAWNIDKGEITPSVHGTLPGLLDEFSNAAAIGIDVPIGLSSTGTRDCDIEARRLLGRGRASSVFPPPIPEVLDSATHAEAAERSRAAIGKGITIQAFGILDKIAEANRTITPDMQDRVFEVHPEVSFYALAGGPMQHAKKRSAGYTERRLALEGAMQLQLLPRRLAHAWARPAKPDDILDAAVAAWTARRVAERTAVRIPEKPATGAFGLRMEIVY